MRGPAVWLTASALLAAVVGLAPGAGAEPREVRHAPLDGTTASAVVPVDRFALLARSETFVQLFRRALLPGPGGAAVTRELASPFTQYLSLSASGVDAPWQEDAVDLELSAWGQLWPTSSTLERPFDGDLQTANVGLRRGALSLRAGRQQVVGGAARFSRFDGLTLALMLPAQLSFSVYGGLNVLPRWDARPGYEQLGLRERELSGAEPLSLSRAAHWLTGARFGYAGKGQRLMASLHEQREAAGLAHRNLGLDGSTTLGQHADLGASALYALDEQHFAEARAYLDLRPLAGLSATFEALRAKPALLLSRQSVLSVFGSSAYDEAGGFLSWQVLELLRVEGAGYVEAYDTGRPGARGDGAARFELGGRRRTIVRVGYGRVIIGEDGYQQLRASLARDFGASVQGVLELYGYFYDRPVLGYRSSAVYSGSLSYRPSPPLQLLWGASVFRSPYASLDAQTLLRASYAFDLPAPDRTP